MIAVVHGKTQKNDGKLVKIGILGPSDFSLAELEEFVKAYQYHLGNSARIQISRKPDKDIMLDTMVAMTDITMAMDNSKLKREINKHGVNFNIFFNYG